MADFLQKEETQKHNFHKINKQAEQQKKDAMETYRTLCRPLWNQFMEAVVKKTGLQLKDIIGNYWFKTPEWHYVSTAFDTFHFIKGNRPLDPGHVINLIYEFEKNGYYFNTAVVNETGWVIDGQHRLAALSYMKKEKNIINPYIFDIMPNGDIEDIEKHNTNRSEWDLLDKLQSWNDLAMPAYQTLYDLYYNKYEQRIPISEMISIFCTWEGGNMAWTDDFNKRKINIFPSNLEKWSKFLDKLILLYDTIYPSKWWKISSSRCRLLVKLYLTPNFSYARLLDCFTQPKSPQVPYLQNLTSQNRDMISKYIIEIYNFRTTTWRLDVRDWNDLKKKVKWSFANLDTITIK